MKKLLLLLLIPMLLFAQSATITGTIPVGIELTGDYVSASGKMVTYLNTVSSVLDTATITYETADTIQCTISIGRDTTYTVTVYAGTASDSKNIKYSEGISGTKISAVFKVN